MGDIGRRFELFGRACDGGRFELAEYELGEIGETFEDKLGNAEPPREGHPEVLPPMERDFVETELPNLQRAVASRDRSAAVAAFRQAAEACNSCHEASGHGFIEVPLEVSRAIPVTDPTAPEARR